MKWFVRQLPYLPHKLRTARLPDSPEYYVKKTLMTSLMLTVGLIIVAFLFVQSPAVLFLFFLFPALFAYFLHFADMKILQLSREVDSELVYAGRFLIIELESGVPLYDTFLNLAKNYEHVGRYFQEVIDRVNLGTSIEQAMNDQLEYLPSDGLRKIFWQILNSLRTGSQISSSLSVAVEHVVRTQRIAVIEYGRKLNPLAMFYMMIAVILPSLGITMLIVMATFIGFSFSLLFLLAAALMLLFMQFMFLAMIRSQRPPVSF